MSEQKRFTEQEMRQTAEMDFYANKLGLDDRPDLTDEIRSMLRQAADAEEEREANEKVKWSTDKSVNDGRDRLISENAKLKARLEAVVKYAEENTWDESGEKNAYLDTTTRIHNHDMRAILRAARGEGGAK